MLLSHFNRELDKKAIIFEFLGKSFRNLEKRFLDRTFPLKADKNSWARKRVGCSRDQDFGNFSVNLSCSYTRNIQIQGLHTI